jgi:hypothetical protein
MTPQARTHVRKRHHLVELGLPAVDDKSKRELIDSIYFVEPSLVRRSLVMVVHQPVVGNVHTTVMTMVQKGVEWCRVSTLMPERPDLLKAKIKGHLVFHYSQGRIIDHRLPMTTDDLAGDDLMIHELEIDFRGYKVEAHEWSGEPDAVGKPRLTLMPGGLTD